MTGPGRACPARGPRLGWPLATAIGIAVAAVVALSGCGQEPVQWPDDPVPAASTLDAAEAEAATEIQTVLATYRDASAGIHAAPPPPDEAKRQLTNYLADPLLTITLLELDLLRSRGWVRTGAPTSEATVVEIRMDQTPPSATLRECLDATGWPVTDQAGTELTEVTGLPTWATPQRHVLTVTARLLDDQWLLDDAHVERGEQC